MEFIADTLAGMCRHVEEEGKSTLHLTSDQYRDVITSEFMNELVSRAKAATQLPLPVAEPLANALYKTFMRVERLHWRRGISDTMTLTSAHVADHELVVRIEVERLRNAQMALKDYIQNAQK
jgi:hypothetical protein